MNDEIFNILFLARIERAKGIYEAIDALAALRRKKLRATLTVAGDGPELSAARAYADMAQTGGVRFLGCVTGPAKTAAFAGADAYLFPTTYGEGMPTCVLEAMAHGLAVVTRPVGGLADFFEHGRMGFITESTDPAVFAGYIEQLMTSPGLCGEMGRYNRLYAMEHFAASRAAARIREIHRTVIAGAGNH